MKLCSAAGCFNRVPLGVKYCEKHRKAFETYQGQLHDKDSKVTPERHRNNQQRYYERMYGEKEGKYQRFYHSTAWRKTSRRWLQNNPVCVECLKHGIIKRGEIVDHIIPIRVDWSKRLDISNLQTLCKAHHNRKTAAEKQ